MVYVGSTTECCHCVRSAMQTLRDETKQFVDGWRDFELTDSGIRQRVRIRKFFRKSTTFDLMGKRRGSVI